MTLQLLFAKKCIHLVLEKIRVSKVKGPFILSLFPPMLPRVNKFYYNSDGKKVAMKN